MVIPQNADLSTPGALLMTLIWTKTKVGRDHKGVSNVSFRKKNTYRIIVTDMLYTVDCYDCYRMWLTGFKSYQVQNCYETTQLFCFFSNRAVAALRESIRKQVQRWEGSTDSSPRSLEGKLCHRFNMIRTTISNFWNLLNLLTPWRSFKLLIGCCQGLLNLHAFTVILQP